jgi:hypothetical protein
MTNSKSGTFDRFFIGLCEHVFHARLGVPDEPLVDYVSDLIVRFIRFDQIHRVRNLAGRPAHEVADLMSEAEQRIGLARRDVHRHIGDVTLFWTGVYPEALPRLRDVAKNDFLIDYTQQGKRAYYIASKIETDREEDAPADARARMSVNFEMRSRPRRNPPRVGCRDGDTPRPLIIN